MKATFQVVLKQPVYPQYFLARKLFDVVQAEAVVIGDYDFATVSEWISVSYYTAYKSVARRHVLGFTLELPDEIDEQIARRIIEGDADDATLDSLGSLLQADAETVEAVLRYHDDGLLADISKYHPEIFELEMKLREVLNYIFCYNLKNHDVFDIIKDFENVTIKNPETTKQIQKYKAKKKFEKPGENLKHPFALNFENEIFHLVVSDYSKFTKPKKRNLTAMKSKIGGCADIQELKDWLAQTVNFSKLNLTHKIFVDDVKTRIKPIETMRNDIMHNRKISQETINSFGKAKSLMLGWIEKFWQQEFDPQEDRVVEPMMQANFILKSLLESLNFESEGSFTFSDLNFDEQGADDQEDLQSQFMDIINDKLSITDQGALAQLVMNGITEKITEKASLNTESELPDSSLVTQRTR